MESERHTQRQDTKKNAGLAALVNAAARRRGRSNEDVARALKRQKRDDTKPPLQVLAPARVAAFLGVALDVLGAPPSLSLIHI